ncbi:MAG: hypothetical protein GY834_07520 [Bacteroidetes bacterium]|jgi:hypothetical protein|nr:hypothetical protein [Bacteroidota bacterium]
MGYSSQVIIGIPKTEKVRLFKLQNSERRFVFPDLFSLLKETKDGMMIYTSIFDLKWYSPYPDVKIIEDFLYDLEERGLEAFQICIGEDQVVHSEIGRYYEHLEINLQVNIYD